MKSEEYHPHLDGIRALAILLVIPHNSNIYGTHPGLFLPLAISAHIGWIGVQLFFVLSGFLISGSLLDRRASPHYYRSFYVRRALRIFPLYYLALTVGAFAAPLLASAAGTGAVDGTRQLWWWVFLSNWVEPYNQDVTGFSHFWSLAVEEQFYLLWPLVVSRWSGKALLRVCGVLTAAALLSRILMIQIGAPALAGYMFTICRMDALAIGSAAAVLIRNQAATDWLRSRAKPLLIVAATALVFDTVITHAYTVERVATQLVGYPILAFAFVLLILVTTAQSLNGDSTALNRWLAVRPLRSIGRYSFAMYVIHLPLAILLTPWFEHAFTFAGGFVAPLFALTIAVLSYGFGFVSYRMIERPFLRLKPVLAPIH